MSKSQKLNRSLNSTRSVIIEVLIKCAEGAYANEILPSRLSRSKFSDPDKALITKVVYSTVRQQIRYDNVIEKLSSRKIKNIDLVALVALRSIIAQLVDGFEMHAVVNETVKVLPFSMKSFVNAVSRKAIGEYKKGTLFENEQAHVEFALPKWIFNEAKKVFGDNYRSVCESFNENSYVTLARVSANAKQPASVKHGNLVPDSLLVRRTGDLDKSSAIASGEYIVCDQGSQLVAAALDLDENNTVLDTCSAPGGKSILISKRAGRVISNDVSFKRLEKLTATKQRTKTSNIDIVSSNAKSLPFANETFNRILVDAPCSGLGVMRRRPDLRHNISEKDIEELQLIQKEILTESIRVLSSGGQIVFSVCTFTEKETIDIDDWLKTDFPGMEPCELNFDTELICRLGRGYLLRATGENDSMYLIKLQKL